MSGITRWDRDGDVTTGLGARRRMLIKVGSAEVGGLIEMVEWDEPNDLAWSSVTGIDQRGRFRLRPVGQRLDPGGAPLRVRRGRRRLHGLALRAPLGAEHLEGPAPVAPPAQAPGRVGAPGSRRRGGRSRARRGLSAQLFFPASAFWSWSLDIEERPSMLRSARLVHELSLRAALRLVRARALSPALARGLVLSGGLRRGPRLALARLLLVHGARRDLFGLGLGSALDPSGTS